ncbi:MAG: hypothetical protein CMJ18_19730 [Phycisphaeraceae bacterium]|nr:hypothetical protein [Phycisphaeraceae bacterium]
MIMKCSPHTACVAASFFVLLGAGIAVCAPILPKGPKTASMVASLQGVRKFSVEVHATRPDVLDQIDLPIRKIESRIRQMLRSKGAEVVPPEEGVARLVMRVVILHEPKVPDAVAYSFSLRVDQSARIERLGSSLHLPTYTITSTGLEHADDVRMNASRNFGLMLDAFVDDLDKLERLPETRR